MVTSFFSPSIWPSDFMFRHSLLLLPLLLQSPLFAQATRGATARPERDTLIAAGHLETPDRSSDGRRRIVASQAAAAIKVDGVLDDSAWATAQVASGFVQSEPHEGEPATEATEVRIIIDATTLYIGARLVDRTPSAIVVNDIRKDFDETQQDDFEIILDTFGDRRNGYVFITNLAGAKADRQISGEGKEVNGSWDAVWNVRTRRTEDGWVAEVAIPLRALRFEPGTSTRWGVNFSRRIRRKNEVDFWSPVPRSYGLYRVSLAGNLDSISTGSSGRDLRIKPYVAGRTVRETGGASFSQKADAGVDLKLGIGRSLTMDGTVNPDFAQVEADEQQVNLTQFSQFFPEKREFFLENSGIFYVGDAARNQRIGNTAATPDEDLLLFFSRRIGLTDSGSTVPIDGGLRLTGKAGAYGTGVFDLQTRGGAGQGANNYAVVRVRRDILHGSDIGIIAMNRQSTDSSNNYNRVYGADANIRFFGVLDWSSYLIGTSSPNVSSGQYAARTSFNYDGNFYHVKLGLMSIGDGFRDDLGYYRRTDVRKYLVEAGIRPRFASLQQIGILEMHPHIGWNYYENQAGQMVGKLLHTGYTFFLNNGGYVELSVNPEMEQITDPFEIDGSIPPIPPGDYFWHTWRLSGQTDPSRMVSVTAEGIVGGLWSGTQRTFNGGVTLHPFYKLQLSTGLQHTTAELDSPPHSHFHETLWTGRMNFSFTTNMFFDGLVQYEADTHLVSANLRFNFIHHPLSDLYLVFNEQRYTSTDPLIAPGRSVILKFTQMLAF